MKTASASRAASLVEVAVALAILAVGLYAMADLLGASRRTAHRAEQRIQAASLGRLKLEEFRASGPNLLALLPQRGAPEVLYPAEGFRPFEQNPSYEWQAAIRALPAFSGQAEVCVSVRPRKGSAEAVFHTSGLAIVSREVAP